MSRQLSSWIRLSVVGGSSAALLILAVGCGSDDAPLTSQTSRFEVADEVSSDEGPGTSSLADVTSAAQSGDIVGERPKPPTHAPGTQAGSSNNAAELLTMISQLQALEPQGNSREEAIADLQKTQQRIIQTAEQVLALDGVGDSMLLAAAQAKMSSLNQLSQVGFPEARDHLLQFCDSLKESDNQLLVDLGRRVGFASRLDAFATGTESDPSAMLEDFRSLVKNEQKDEQLIQLGLQIGAALEQTGKGTEAGQVIDELALAFKDVEDPQLKDAVEALQEEGELIASGIRPTFMKVLEGDEAARGEFMTAAKKLLESENRGVATVGFLLQQAAFNLETLQPEMANELYPLIADAYAEYENPEIAEYVTSTIDRYNKRSSLIGEPFEVQGEKLDGEALDWSQYKGKVVLVDFWATWCGPCLQEMPNIKRNLEKYQEQGFEVVGVNLDDNAENVDAFFSVQELPWPTVVSADPEARGMETPLAVESGVEFIPFIVLIGRDGKVAALNVRGENLAPKLEELLAQSAE